MALSQENIEKLRRAYAAFSRGDFDEALTYAHPDIEYVPADGAAPVRGLETFRAWMEPDAFEWQVIEPVDFVGAGNNVLVRHRIRSRGAGSGMELEASFGPPAPRAGAPSAPARRAVAPSDARLISDGQLHSSFR